MRLTPAQIEIIRQATRDIAGPAVRVRLFDSRLDDDARGGDIDLLLECDEQVDAPALLAAKLAARVSRRMDGRKIDVVISRAQFIGTTDSSNRYADRRSTMKNAPAR